MMLYAYMRGLEMGEVRVDTVATRGYRKTRIPTYLQTLQCDLVVIESVTYDEYRAPRLSGVAKRSLLW